MTHDIEELKNLVERVANVEQFLKAAKGADSIVCSLAVEDKRNRMTQLYIKNIQSNEVIAIVERNMAELCKSLNGINPCIQSLLRKTFDEFKESQG